jgi:hypothetical protein
MCVNSTRALTNRHFHYAWVIVLVTFAVLIITAGVRATPGVLMVPLEAEFGWTTAAISTAIAINIALFGGIGPFAASLGGVDCVWRRRCGLHRRSDLHARSPGRRRPSTVRAST